MHEGDLLPLEVLRRITRRPGDVQAPESFSLCSGIMNP